jgi:hypothetical protein
MTTSASPSAHSPCASHDSESTAVIPDRRNPGGLGSEARSPADLAAAERVFRRGAPPEGAAASLGLSVDAVGLLALFLYAHTAGVAAAAFSSRRDKADRAWSKRYFRALSEFLVASYDPAFPMRAAAAHAEAAAANGRAVSGVNLMSSESGRAAARFCLAPLVAGHPLGRAAVEAFCAHANAVGAGTSPLGIEPAEVQRFFTLVRQTPRLRSWLDESAEPAPVPDALEGVHIEDLAELLAMAQPAAS